MAPDEKNSLDFKLMYKQFSQEKRGYKEELNAIFISTIGLEISINNMIDSIIKELKSENLENWVKNSNVPITAKLRLLRFSNIIDEQLYRNMAILFKIRNQFAHRLLIPKEDKVYDPLKEIKIKNDFVDGLPNDSIKLQLIASHCFSLLFHISKKIVPESVLDLTLEGEITPIDD